MNNIEQYLYDIVKPILRHPDDLMVKQFKHLDDRVLQLNLYINEKDMGLMIGKKGVNLDALKTVIKMLVKEKYYCVKISLEEINVD